MAGPFETWAKQWRIGWNGVNGQAFWGAAGKLLGDRIVDDSIYAAKQSLPEYAELANAKQTCYERGVEPGSALTQAQVGALGRSAATLNRYRGTPLGMLVAAHFAGFNDGQEMVIVQQNGRGHYLNSAPSLDDLGTALTNKTKPSWYEIATLGTNPAIGGNQPLAAGVHAWWTFDSGIDPAGDQFCSRFGVLYPYPGALPAGWTAPVSPPTGATAPTKAEVNRLIRLIQAWKPAKATCMWIRVATGDMIVWGWPPTQAWGDPGLAWGGGGGSVVEWNGETEYP